MAFVQPIIRSSEEKDLAGTNQQAPVMLGYGSFLNAYLNKNEITVRI
jgi:hypothetical protein